MCAYGKQRLGRSLALPLHKRYMFSLEEGAAHQEIRPPARGDVAFDL